MTESFVTQCPHCHTSFKVSHNQLSVARGAVRCGACKQVFNAARQLLEQHTGQPNLPGVPASVAALPAEAPRQPMSQAEWQATNAHLEHLDLDQELARLERRAGTPRAGDGEAPGLSAQRDQSEDWLDEPFGEPFGKPFGEHEDEKPATAPATAPASVPSLGTRAEPVLGLDREPALDDNGFPAPPARPPKPERSASSERQALTAEREDAATRTYDEDDEPHQADHPPARRGKRNEPELRDDHLLDLQDDPLQLQWEKPRRSLGKRLLWAGLALLAALALLGQYVVFHFDELARQDAYRPWFVSLCPPLGCTVPSRVDIRLIRSSNLVVRSHPTFAGALVVDAIIYNRAPFSQPFPLLELRFADLNNKLIASRRFKPSEYLSGDLAGQSEMPPQIPIHIALDILDPGKRAVNYSLSFHSPE